MSKQYDNKNRGALFIEQEKSNERAPDMKGPINVSGQEYQLAAWKQETKDGRKYLSITIEPQKASTKKSNQSLDAANSSENDEIPF